MKAKEKSALSYTSPLSTHFSRTIALAQGACKGNTKFCK